MESGCPHTSHDSGNYLPHMKLSAADRPWRGASYCYFLSSGIRKMKARRDMQGWGETSFRYEEEQVRENLYVLCTKLMPYEFLGKEVHEKTEKEENVGFHTMSSICADLVITQHGSKMEEATKTATMRAGWWAGNSQALPGLGSGWVGHTSSTLNGDRLATEHSTLFYILCSFSTQLIAYLPAHDRCSYSANSMRPPPSTRVSACTPTHH